jgi:hypothetical protein
MLAASPQALPDNEAVTWTLYSRQRIPELRAARPDIAQGLAESIAWFEFIQAKWGLSCDAPFPGMNRFEYALRVHSYGPDMRGVSRFRSDYVTSRRFQRKQASPKPKKLGKADSGRPSQCNSAYTYFVKKRFRQMKAEHGGSLRVADTIPIIGSEWKEMSAASRNAVVREWKEFLANPGAKTDNAADQ